MTAPVLARLAAIKTAPTPELKKMWRDLFGADAPPYNRRFLESRLAYRVQELAYGGLKPETIRRLEALGKQLDGGNITLRRIRRDQKPVAGTRLIRDWQGVKHIVTVRDDGYEYQGRPYKDCPRRHRDALERLGVFRVEDPEGAVMKQARSNSKIMPKVRCAVYTRKSSEEGLEQEFNSLDAQREACEAYVASQRPEGWILLHGHYDDGGFSGGTLERPALKRLLADIELGRIDVVVVYKIDRLSRSLMDFAKLVEAFERNSVTFVSVTQSFNTTTSMGRLTLNILLSFAQFEREVIGERIRDKFAASRKKGMWMGGYVPLGYRVEKRKLVIEEREAAIVRTIFERFVKVGSATVLARQLNAEGVTTRAGRPVDKGFLYKLLNNQVYAGMAVHKGTAYPGEHEAIVSRDLWDKVHAILQESPRTRANKTRRVEPALLRGLLFSPSGLAMTPTHTRRKGKLYRYYATTSVLKLGPETCPIRRVSAAEIEQAVIGQLRGLLRAPEIIVRTWRAAEGNEDITEAEVREACERLDPLWDELFPAEQARIVQLLVERVDVSMDGVAIRLRTEGLTSLCAEMRAREPQRRAA